MEMLHEYAASPLDSVILLIDGLEQVSVKQEKQNKGECDGANTCKLHRKAQLASALFSKCNRQAETDPTDQRCGSHQNRDGPSEKA